MSPENDEGGPVAETATQIAAKQIAGQPSACNRCAAVGRQHRTREPQPFHDSEIVRQRACDLDRRERFVARWDGAKRRRDGHEPDPPSTYGLDEPSLHQHAVALVREGQWQEWELEARFGGEA